MRAFLLASFKYPNVCTLGIMNVPYSVLICALVISFQIQSDPDTG
jgi:hypothetical protein